MRIKIYNYNLIIYKLISKYFERNIYNKMSSGIAYACNCMQLQYAIAYISINV